MELLLPLASGARHLRRLTRLPQLLYGGSATLQLIKRFSTPSTRSFRAHSSQKMTSNFETHPLS